jgi:two-component system sensor histidine kinase YesM
MKIPEKIKDLSINRKIFWSMVTTSTIIILAILTATCGIIVNKCMDLETASSIQNLDHITRQLDFLLTSVGNFSKTIIVNSTVQEITNKFNTKNEKFNELDQIQLKDEINKIIQSTTFIYGVNIYSPAKQVIASTEVLKNESSISQLQINTNRIWLTTQKISIYDKTQTIPVLILVQKFYSYNTGKFLGYIEISIPESSISGIYNTAAAKSGSGICVVNSAGFVQSTDGSYPMYSLYPNFAQVINENNSGYHFIKNKIVFYKYFAALDWYIISEVGSNIFLQPIYALIIISVLIAFCGVIICTIFSHKIAQTITHPLYKLVQHIQKVIQGKWDPVPNVSEQNEIGFLFNKFNDMLTAQATLTENLIKEQKMKQKLSLDLLQEQVNPHFLYNTLDNICSLAEIGETEALISVVMNLSQFYRETLSRGSFFVTIKDEIAITNAYLSIMHIRYFNKFEFTITCPAYLKEYPCLKLLLQPIVENSIYHGITQIPETGIIHIDISECEDGILFTVSDNGIGITHERMKEIWKEESDNFGLKNVDQRIKLYYGEAYGLAIKQNTERGCTITIKIAKEV